jgi:hypothetical protein
MELRQTNRASSPPYSLYERKALLINREFDLMGLGRYQKCIWLLCGFGYLLDLLWAQAFGLSESLSLPSFFLERVRRGSSSPRCRCRASLQRPQRS